MDCFLVSAATGCTLFTTFVFGSHPLEKAVVKPDPRPARFRAAVVHEGRSCPAARTVPAQYHFLITASGEVVPTLAWKQRGPCRSTLNETLNAQTLAVVLESAGREARKLQLKSFRSLLDELKSREGIEISSIFTHAQVERGGCKFEF